MEAAGVELDTFSKTGLIRRIPAKLDPLKPPEPLKCSRAGTKQVQQIAWLCPEPSGVESDDSASETPGTIHSRDASCERRDLLAHQRTEHVSCLRAERLADADLSCMLRHRQRDKSEHACERQQRGD